MEVCRQCLAVLSNFITFRDMGSQSSSVLDNSLMDSQSLLDCSSQLSQQPMVHSPVRNTTNNSAIDNTVPSSVTAAHIETSSLAKVQLYCITILQFFMWEIMNIHYSAVPGVDPG